MAEEAQHAQLSSFEEQLRRPDFVLEPRCYQTIVGFRGAGGKPENAIEFLSDGYMGYPQMASLVCQWLRLATDGGQHGQHGSSDAGSSGAGPSGMPGGHDSAPSSASSHFASSRTSRTPPVLDEFHFLKEFAKQKFDSEKMANVFQKYNGKPPPWLEHLTQDPRGRQLIYELSAAHRNCLLLNYGIQKILFQGHEDEVASVGSSLASYFSVFHRLLAARLRAVVSHCCSTAPGVAAGESSSSMHTAASTGAPCHGPGQSKVLPGLARELLDSCGHSLHTYLHAQQLLTRLGRHPHGHVFQRMSQELEQASAQAHPAVWSMLSMFMPLDSSLAALDACSRVGTLLTSHPPYSGVEHLQLAALYSDDPGLSVQPIQQPAFIKLLVANVFTPGKLLPSDAQAAAVELLARATSCRDHDGQVSDAQEAAARIDATREALQAALELGQRAQGKMSAQDTMLAYQVAEMPVACVGLLHYMRCHLAQRDFYHEAAAALTATPAFARLAVFIAKKQPGLMHLVIDLFHAALTALGSQRAELAKVFLDASVVLLRDCHCTRELTAMVDRWSSKGREGQSEADPSLVRYLINQMLSALAAPYSPWFAAWLLRLMVLSGVRRGRDAFARPDAAPRAGTNAGLLHEFAVAAAGLVFRPPLLTREAALLQDLQYR